MAQSGFEWRQDLLDKTMIVRVGVARLRVVFITTTNLASESPVLRESRSCSVLTVCSTPVVREEVSARVPLLRVGLATLRLSLYTYVCTA